MLEPICREQRKRPDGSFAKMIAFCCHEKSESLIFCRHPLRKSLSLYGRWQYKGGHFKVVLSTQLSSWSPLLSQTLTHYDHLFDVLFSLSLFHVHIYATRTFPVTTMLSWALALTLQQLLLMVNNIRSLLQRTELFVPIN